MNESSGGLPPAYPRECEAVAHTREGAEFRIRPIRPDDLEREYAFVRGLSAETRYNRLMYAVHEPTDALLLPLVNIDYHDHMALVALMGAGENERIVGVARYAASNIPGHYEFAVVVTDQWQGHGIGRRLLRDLFEHARRHGLTRLVGTVLPDNQRMLALARGLGLAVATSPLDASLVVVSMSVQPESGVSAAPPPAGT